MIHSRFVWIRRAGRRGQADTEDVRRLDDSTTVLQSAFRSTGFHCIWSFKHSDSYRDEYSFWYTCTCHCDQISIRVIEYHWMTVIDQLSILGFYFLFRPFSSIFFYNRFTYSITSRMIIFWAYILNQCACIKYSFLQPTLADCSWSTPSVFGAAVGAAVSCVP